MLIQLLSNPATVVALSATLIILFIWSALRFEASVGKLRKPLRALLAVLREPADSHAFACEFENVLKYATSAVEGDPVLDTEWRLCAQCLVQETDRVMSSRGLDDLFQSGRVMHRAPITSYRSLPGVLIGLGLVFTFAGISVVISQAGSALVDAGNMDALHGLLSAAGLKFVTSLVGVGLSVLCGLHYRMRTGPITELLSSIRRRIQLLAPHAGQGDLLRAITALRSDLDDAARSALKGIVEGAATALTDAVSGQMSAIAAPVEKLTNAVGGITAKFVTIGSQIDTCTERLAETIETFATRLGESAESLSDEFATIRSHASDTTKSFAKIATEAGKAGSSADKLKDMITKLEAVLSSLGRLGTLPADLGAATAALSAAGTELSSLWASYTHRIETADHQLSRSVDVLPGMLDQYSAALKTYTTDLDGHLTQTLQALQQWVEHIARLQEAATSRPRNPSFG